MSASDLSVPVLVGLPGGFTEEKKKLRTRSLARYLLNSVLDLGPTFIKLGQLSSTRADLFPAEFVDELSTLQVRCWCPGCDPPVGYPYNIAIATFQNVPHILARPIDGSHDGICPSPPHTHPPPLPLLWAVVRGSICTNYGRTSMCYV